MVREKPYATNNIRRNTDFPFDEAFVLLRKLYFLSLNQVIVTHCGICFTQCLNIIFEEIEKGIFHYFRFTKTKNYAKYYHSQ